MIGEGEAVALGVEEEGEAAVVGGDEVGVGGMAAGELEDGVPVELLVVVEPLLAGDEGVRYGEDLVGGVEAGRVGVAGADREGLAADEVAAGEELLGDEEPAVRLGSVAAAAVGFHFSLFFTGGACVLLNLD